MNRAVYDSRFFAESYYSKDESVLKKLRNLKVKERYISAVVIHEVYNLALKREGREIAQTKIAGLRIEFEIVSVDDHIAEASAELRHKYDLPMGDSMIAATALMLKAVCITDDRTSSK